MTAPAGYTALAGGYSFARLRVGLVVRNPVGAEVYCQPGDETAAMLETIEALQNELHGHASDAAQARVTDIALGDYFG